MYYKGTQLNKNRQYLKGLIMGVLFAVGAIVILAYTGQAGFPY